jgi:hypothetical protein
MQTSIEWLENQLDIVLPIDFEWRKIEKILEQAKEMHKQEIIDAVNSINVECEHYDEHKWNYENGEQYYNETFKKD